ncbi:MAG TPA: hypothetical protein EYP49_20280 [Anaerolineae bacterium]|nr:hypothetical protein [Anaerolineae bacterium]
MTRYLLAAEADKIQDFIFRAAHLREAVGGSQLLTRFGDRKDGAPPNLGVPDKDLIVSGGGSFRALFDTRDQAAQFGRQLAEVYYQATGGSLTVIAEPEEVKDEADFARASRVAQEKLREAKRRRPGRLTTVHLPYVAFCASCGVGLASRHEKRHPKAERSQYLCDDCLAKGAERAEESLGAFLKPFVQAVVGEKENPYDYVWPGRDRPGAKREIDPTTDLGRFDPRNYVAYLVADGNNMGKVFDHCDEKQMRRLSEAMEAELRASLVAATQELKKGQPEVAVNVIPVLPLILGGDDLFALLPAPWALDFARHFCTEFEERMTNLVNGLNLSDRGKLPERITVAAGVVVCKFNYPFYLAHSVGEERLRAAKQVAKRLAGEPGGKMHSVVDFEIILGSQVGAKSEQGDYRATLRPYWLSDEGVPSGWGIQLKALLDQRWELRNLPGKRLAQLRSLYRPSVLRLAKDDLKRWESQKETLLQRIGRDKDTLTQVKAAFTALGGKDWRTIERRGEDEWHGHGLPDLLEAWDFAYRLDKPRRGYEEV